MGEWIARWLSGLMGGNKGEQYITQTSDWIPVPIWSFLFYLRLNPSDLHWLSTGIFSADWAPAPTFPPLPGSSQTLKALRGVKQQQKWTSAACESSTSQERRSQRLIRTPALISQARWTGPAPCFPRCKGTPHFSHNCNGVVCSWGSQACLNRSGSI